MKIAVTGGAGFVGTNLVDALLAAGHTVTVIDMQPPHRLDVDHANVDILDLRGMVKATKGCDVIFHLAGFADVNEAFAHPVEATQTNVAGTAHVLEAARQNAVARVVLASTVWVYAAADPDRVATEDSPLQPARAGHVYTASKIAAELIVHGYNTVYGQEFTILRYGIPYGPRMRPTLVLARFVRAGLAGDPVTVFGDGSHSRNYVYIEDLVDAHLRALGPAGRNEVFNLEGPEKVSVNRMVDAVSAALDRPLAVTRQPDRPGEFEGRTVSAEKAERVLGWKANTSFEDGVRRYLTWYRADVKAPAAAAAPAPVGARWAPVALALVLSALASWLVPQARDRPVIALVAVAALAALALAVVRFVTIGRQPARRFARTIGTGATAAVLSGVLWTGANSPTVKWFGPSISHADRASNQVALTFDDGPNETATLQIAKVLDDHGVKGTFFQVGKAVAAKPEITLALIQDGHLVGNHSYHHDAVRWLAPSYPELNRTQETFERIAHVCPAFFRPPHGQHTPSMWYLTHHRHMAMVMWDVSVADWKATDAQRIARAVVEQAKPGSIIDLHDGLNGDVVTNRTVLVRAMPAILDGLARRGLQPVRLDALLGKPGYVSNCD